MTTGFLYDDRFLEHDAGSHHPERKERLISTTAFLAEQPWFSSLKPVVPRICEREWIEKIHTGHLIDRARETCASGAPYLDVADVGICTDSYDVALLAAGGALALADAVVAREIDNGFALSRPPGHHAERDMALGFCLFNNVAIAARYLQEQHGLDKILILDWDVHHGNGTQHSFEEDPSVLYVSMHQYPYYPGSGAAAETGTGRGAGATVNCPMSAGSGDGDYEDAFMQRILPAIDEFKPDAVILSAGFDAHIADPLADIRLSTGFFGWMSERMMEVADRYAGGRLVSMLEGGYNIDALPLCVAEHLQVLAGQRPGTPS
ncbi:MAG: histone deacetylase family protein [Gammaproteobacteria bacterium]